MHKRNGIAKARIQKGFKVVGQFLTLQSTIIFAPFFFIGQNRPRRGNLRKIHHIILLLLICSSSITTGVVLRSSCRIDGVGMFHLGQHKISSSKFSGRCISRGSKNIIECLSILIFATVDRRGLQSRRGSCYWPSLSGDTEQAGSTTKRRRRKRVTFSSSSTHIITHMILRMRVLAKTTRESHGRCQDCYSQADNRKHDERVVRRQRKEFKSKIISLIQSAQARNRILRTLQAMGSLDASRRSLCLFVPVERTYL